jgi:hypothetical protein
VEIEGEDVASDLDWLGGVAEVWVWEGRRVGL